MRAASWIWSDNLRSFFEILGRLCGYTFDDADWAAVEAGVRDTDGERDSRYSYPLGERTSWVVRIAQDPGTDVVLVQLDCADATDEQSAKLELLLELANTYVLKRR